jgi:hypothetical protein
VSRGFRAKLDQPEQTQRFLDPKDHRANQVQIQQCQDQKVQKDRQVQTRQFLDPKANKVKLDQVLLLVALRVRYYSK